MVYNNAFTIKLINSLVKEEERLQMRVYFYIKRIYYSKKSVILLCPNYQFNKFYLIIARLQIAN